MPLSLIDPEADHLAETLASLTGRPVGDAVLYALREQVRREGRRLMASRVKDDLRLISDRCAALPDLDTRTPEEIIGFDEHGLAK